MPPAKTGRSKAAPARPRVRKAGMTLAEALIVRADSQKRLQQLKVRLLAIAKVQEGDRPAEDPASLIEEIEGVAGELLRLIQRINRTNSLTELEKGLSISDAIAARDVLKLRHGVYRELAAAAVVTQDRRTKSEVRFKSTVNIAKLQRSADDIAKQHRELDAKIQAANWQHQLHD